MNIWIICHPTYGWSGIIATNIALSLAKKWHNIHIISSDMPVKIDLWIYGITFHQVDIHEYPLFEFPLYQSNLITTIIDVAIKHKLDIIHAHYAIPHASAAYMAQQVLAERWFILPYIITLHGTDVSVLWKDPSFHSIVEFALNHADAVTAVSQSLKNQAWETFMIKKPINVIYNFTHTEENWCNMSQDTRKDLAKDNEKIIIHVSNFRPIKRIKDIIAIFYEIQRSIPSKLIMVGDGPDREWAEEMCDQIGISDKVFFTGFRTNPKELLQYADLFLLPSEKESFWLSILEWFTCHVPAITTNVGGLPEINIHGETWYLCKVGDMPDMVSYAITLLSDEKKLHIFKSNAYKQSKKFDEWKIINQYEELYKTIINTL